MCLCHMTQGIITEYMYHIQRLDSKRSKKPVTSHHACSCYAVIVQLPVSVASVLIRGVHTPQNACHLHNIFWRMTISPLVHWPGTWRQLRQHQSFGQGVRFRSVCFLCGIMFAGCVAKRLRFGYRICRQ